MDALQQAIRDGRVTVVGNGLYVVCPDCHELVRINKPIFGGLHLCSVEAQQQVRKGQR
jgi:murein DD-endopeptidase MepM/ murein hydrolase activator NlpD